MRSTRRRVTRTFTCPRARSTGELTSHACKGLGGGGGESGRGSSLCSPLSTHALTHGSSSLTTHSGVGGVFFDDLERLDPPSLPPSEQGVRRAKAFTEAVARAFMPSYLPSEWIASFYLVGVYKSGNSGQRTVEWQQQGQR